MKELTGTESPQGTKVSWSENMDLVEGLIWTGYAPKTGEYYATIATFYVDRETKTLTLNEVIIRKPTEGWVNILENKSSYVTDRMKRAVRKFIAASIGTSYWRVNLGV